ncbi:MAG: aldolase/citrate lyase family protein, partial [Clostridia bacterium]|nr:aldolase/citrate lyase family protein [Clostridia bacterium]
MNKLKEQLADGRLALGVHICMNECAMTEILGNVGFDYLWIDTEHTSVGLDCLERHLIAARAAGVSAIVRVPANDPI